MTSKCLHGFAGTDIPQFSKGIASTRYKDILVRGVDADRHDVSEVVGKLGHLGPGLDIPQHTGHVTRRSDDAAVIDEATARQIAGVAGEFASNAGRAFTGREIVD